MAEPTWGSTTPLIRPNETMKAPSWDDTVDIQETHGTPGQQLKAGLEGAGQGVLGPLIPYLETKAGVDPEDIKLREQANPWVKGLSEAATFGGTLALTGGISAGAGAALKAGEIGAAAAKGTSALAKVAKYGTVPGLITKAGELAGAATSLGAEGAGIASKMGRAATTAATEMALLGAGNEISQTIQNNPPESLGMALSHVGLSGLIGAVGGGALGTVSPLWKASVGDRAGQMLEDMRGRVKFRLENPDLVNAAGEELNTYYNNISKMNDQTWGPTGIKAQVIEKLMPEMNEQVKLATDDLAASLNSKVLKMQANPDIYPTRLTKQFEAQTNRIIDAVTDPNSTPGKIFDAVQTTKQWAQDSSKSMWKYGSFDVEHEFAKEVGGLAKELRPFLEDPKIWGEAGKAQQMINKGFTKFLPSLEDFEKKFTSKIGNDRVVDMGKVQTLKNQLGRSSGELKQTMLKNFLDDSAAYQKTIADAHASIGSESPFPHSSLSAANGFLGKQTPGSVIVDKLIDRGMANVAGQAIGGLIGAAIGALGGHPGIGLLAGEHAIGPMMTSILPSLVKPIMDHPKSSSGLKAAADYGIAVIKGEKLFNNAAKNLFKGGAEILPKYSLPTEKKRDKLEKALKGAANDPASLLKVGGDIDHYLPDHGAQIGLVAASAISYLEKIRPKPTNAGGILDTKFEPSKMEQAKYERSLDIAEQPLIVVQHIKDGTLLPQDIIGLKTMFPSIYEKLSHSLTQEMIEHLSDGEIIPYKQRMSLSLFMAHPLDATMMPQSIIAAQPPPPNHPQMAQAPQKHGSMKNVNKFAQGIASSPQMREMQKAGTAKT